ncbi:MAG TPA: carboxypeptidase regulatory-like domain-containing protein [Terriglobia bacterium]|nr:carboxypeptidase regulatory-like domain-containing protein [Terriglobia bacterium]
MKLYLLSGKISHAGEARIRLQGLWLALVLAIVCSLPAAAQTSLSTVRGAVTDQSGALVPGAQVRLIDLSTNIAVRTVSTDANGNYEIPFVKGGHYELTASHTGFDTYTQTDIFLASNETKRVDAVLHVGSTATKVTVSGAAKVIQTEGGSIGGTFTASEYKVLPIPGNSYSSPTDVLATMPLLQFDRENAFNPTLAGQGGNQFNMSMDGVLEENVNTQTVNMEDADEVRLLGVNNSAEYSRIATYDVVTKRGTDKFHGELEYYLRNSALGARGFFDSTKQPIIYNTMTAEASGPLGHRTYFYGMWNGERVKQHTSYLTTVPTDLMRAGDFSQLLPSTVITNPATGAPYPGNVIPPSDLSSSPASAVALATQNNYIPRPNIGGPNALVNNFTFVWPYPGDQYNADVYVGRVDHTFSEKDSIYGRFSSYFPKYILAGNYPALGSSRTRTSYSWAVNETHIFAPNLLNSFQFGGNYDWVENGQPLNGFVTPNGADVVSKIGLQGVNPGNLSGEGFPDMSINGLPTMNAAENGGTSVDAKNYSYTDDVTWVKGRHVVKFGAQIRTYYTRNDLIPDTTFGSFAFDGRFSGYPYADFLLGLPGTSTRLAPIVDRSQHAYEMGYYATDTFKVNRRLTLTYGLRWDYFGSPTFGDGLQYNWDAATGNIIVSQANLSKVSPLFPSNIGVVAGNPTPSPDGKNFVPRVSAAYLLDEKTVIRGGYGIFNEALGPFTITQTQPSQGTGPFELSETYINAFQNGTSGPTVFSFPNPFPGTGAQVPSQNPTGFPQQTKNGMIHQWNLSVERQIASVGVRVSYVGSKGSDLNYFINTDLPVPSSTPFDISLLPYPQFVATNLQRNNGSSEYNALSIEGKRRVGAVTFDWNWTWASNLDTMENLQNPYGPLPWNHDYLTPHNRVVLNTMWEIPVGRGRRFGAKLPGAVNQVVGGWSLYWISYFESGLWFTPQFSGSDPSNTNTFSPIPDRICNGNFPPNQRSINGWFNTSCFAVPPNGRFGNSGVNILEGPGLNNQSVSLTKNFPVTERVHIEFSAMASNVFNHPNFENPGTNDITVPGAGVIGAVPDYYSAVKAGPRLVEGRLRVLW